MHCLQRVKWKIGPVYIFLFLFFGAFFIILPYTVLHSAAKHPLMYCLGWFHVEVRWASCMHHLACSILFFSSFLWDVRRLVLWIDFVERESLMAMEKAEWFFFCSINEIFSIRVNADRFSVFIWSIPYLLLWNLVLLERADVILGNAIESLGRWQMDDKVVLLLRQKGRFWYGGKWAAALFSYPEKRRWQRLDGWRVVYVGVYPETETAVKTY